MLTFFLLNTSFKYETFFPFTTNVLNRETNQLICNVNQKNGFDVSGALTSKPFH